MEGVNSAVALRVLHGFSFHKVVMPFGLCVVDLRGHALKVFVEHRMRYTAVQPVTWWCGTMVWILSIII